MHQFRKYLTREQICTIPNFMSLFRLALIPFIVRIYWHGEYGAAAGLVMLSAVSDILDGIIARKCNMVSDLGKMLDPVCDKLTHAALLICLMKRYRYVRWVLGLLSVKELTMLVLGGISVKRKEQVHSAKWYGKVCTVVFESVMIALMLFPKIPGRAAMALLTLCCAVLLFSFTMYVIFFLRVIRSADGPGENGELK